MGALAAEKKHNLLCVFGSSSHVKYGEEVPLPGEFEAACEQLLVASREKDSQVG